VSEALTSLSFFLNFNLKDETATNFYQAMFSKLSDANQQGAGTPLTTVLARCLIFIELALIRRVDAFLPVVSTRQHFKKSSRGARVRVFMAVSKTKVSESNMERIELMSLKQADDNIQPAKATVLRSLAGNYLVEILPTVAMASDDDYICNNNENSEAESRMQETWRFTPLRQFQNKDGSLLAPGALATTALYQHDSSSSSSSQTNENENSMPGSFVLKGQVNVLNDKSHDNQDGQEATFQQNVGRSKHMIGIHAESLLGEVVQQHDDADTEQLLSTLSRVMVQRLTSKYHAHLLKTTLADNSFTIPSSLEWHLQLPQGEDQTIQLKVIADTTTDQNVCQLFSVPNQGTELVEMVCSQGRAIGKLPRNLIHTCNILHRGIGLFVAKDYLPKPFRTAAIEETATNPHPPDHNHNASTSTVSPITAPRFDFPDLYVHRRTSWKRIFPSLYDMFVGGISLAGEDAVTTARREVAEELGLHRGNNALSPPLLACTVCTSYNRCVVTLFCYVVDTVTETISWQKDEVAWGDFVPYSIVEKAADLSIQRLVASKSWPGMYPPTLSSAWAGREPSGSNVQYDQDEWTKWDFVPDGLLVWEAWLKYLQESKA
jgi:8-oxo-dGTP pyrophosphatase MutT (NUDIX family)